MADETTTIDDGELRTLVAEALELPVEDVTDDARFAEDLDVDSLMALEIAVRLEKRYGIAVSDKELAEVGSFAAVRELVQTRLGAAPKG